VVGVDAATVAGWATAAGSSFAVITTNVVCGCRSAIGSMLVVVGCRNATG
jgi:hypothetical protein